MSERKSARWPLVVATLVVLQALAATVYFGIESRRSQPSDATLAYEPLDLPLKSIALVRPSESMTLPSESHDDVTLLHLWATWCAPCREELPTFLALDDTVPLIAASTDETWAVIDHYFDDKTPDRVWRLPNEEALPVNLLPTTLVIKSGRIRARLEGSRSWSNEAVENLVTDLNL